MIKLNQWLDRPEHRILVFLSVWVILSWLVCVPEIQLGRALVKIQSMSDIVNLSLIKDSTFVTRFVSQWLDKTPVLINALTSFKLYELLFLIILVLFSVYDHNFPFVSYSAKSVLVIQMSMHIYLFIQLYRISVITNPTVALSLINQAAVIYQILGFTSLILSFMTIVIFMIKLGANSLQG